MDYARWFAIQKLRLQRGKDYYALAQSLLIFLVFAKTYGIDAYALRYGITGSLFAALVIAGGLGAAWFLGTIDEKFFRTWQNENRHMFDLNPQMREMHEILKELRGKRNA